MRTPLRHPAPRKDAMLRYGTPVMDSCNMSQSKPRYLHTCRRDCQCHRLLLTVFTLHQGTSLVVQHEDFLWLAWWAEEE